MKEHPTMACEGDHRVRSPSHPFAGRLSTTQGVELIGTIRGSWRDSSITPRSISDGRIVRSIDGLLCSDLRRLAPLGDVFMAVGRRYRLSIPEEGSIVIMITSVGADSHCPVLLEFTSVGAPLPG
jgi:hypothetical protein